MARTRRTHRSPFVITLAAAALSVGCGGSVDNGANGQGGSAGVGSSGGNGGSGGKTDALCPGRMPVDGTDCPQLDLTCTYQSQDFCGQSYDDLAKCTAQGWRGEYGAPGTSCNPPPPEYCPPTAPAHEQPCEGVTTCKYEEADECNLPVAVTASCDGQSWSVERQVSGLCNPPPPHDPCPDAEPQAGTGCFVAPDTQCNYQSNCCPAIYQCENNTWNQVPTTCNPPGIVCPEVMPSSGAACDSCAYAACEYNTCSSDGQRFMAECSGGSWKVYPQSCAEPQ